MKKDGRAVSASGHGRAESAAAGHTEEIKCHLERIQGHSLPGRR